MIRRVMLGMLLAVVLLGLAADAARAEGEGYMELVSATPILYEGTPAWEYYYDVYSGGLGSASQIWMHGFDATQLLNPVNQRWDASAADGWSAAFWGDFPSYGSADLTEWELSGNPGEMINPIHTPDEYLVNPNMADAFLYPADITAENELHYWYGSIAQYIPGLYMTIRLVHPLGPGDISYSIIGPFYWEQQNAMIIGPAVASGPAGDFDGDGDVDADDVDICCDNRGDPDFDLDGDGDHDEDDCLFLIENLVELTDGSGRAGTMRGDFNLDGLINGTDLAIMGPGFGLPGLGYAAGNANCDDVINGTDLAILAARADHPELAGHRRLPALAAQAQVGRGWPSFVPEGLRRIDAAEMQARVGVQYQPDGRWFSDCRPFLCTVWRLRRGGVGGVVGHFADDQAGFVIAPVAVDQHQVADVDGHGQDLPEDAHGLVSPDDVVGRQPQRAEQAEVPKRQRDHAPPALFRGDPLNHEAAHERQLRGQAE